jgi:hypothetical protein
MNNDEEVAFLRDALGRSDLALNDLWFLYLRDQGYTGSLADMKAAYVPSVGPDVYFSAGFATDTYLKEDVESVLSDMVSSARNSTSLASNLAGVFSSFSANTPRVTDRGLLVEPARTNEIRNNTPIGVVAGGSTSTSPATNWAQFTGGSITYTTIGSGTEDGLPYYEFNLNGTANANNGCVLSFETASAIVAANGET